jgi:lipopolysaccharide export system protein LptC
MATQPHASTAPRFGGILTATDRTRAFRAARRHSAIVGVLKLGLPLAALGVCALYLLPARLTVAVAGGQASVENVDITSGGLKMINPRFKGVNEKQGVYDIQAESALQHVSDPDLMTLDKINAELVNQQGQKTVLTGPSGIFQRKKEEFTFDKGVTIGGDAGISGQLKTATAFMKEKRLISNDPVVLGFKGHRVASDRVEFFTGENRAIFTGNVRVHLERAAGPGVAGQGAAAQGAAQTAGQKTGQEARQ